MVKCFNWSIFNQSRSPIFLEFVNGYRLPDFFLKKSERRVMTDRLTNIIYSSSKSLSTGSFLSVIFSVVRIVALVSEVQPKCILPLGKGNGYFSGFSVHNSATVCA